MRDRYTSGVHGQNMRWSCACHPTHWHGVPRIFLTAPLSYAAETYAMPKVSSFRATENSQPVLSLSAGIMANCVWRTCHGEDYPPKHCAYHMPANLHPRSMTVWAGIRVELP